MKRFRYVSALAVVGALALAACGDDSNNDATAPETAPPTETDASGDDMTGDEAPGDIVTVASTTEGFSTLVAAVQAAGLVETLQGDGPFTVFAPTDEAFAALPEGLLDSLLLPENQETLQRILTYHVIAGEVRSGDITPGEVETVEGSSVTLDTADGVTVDGANVVAADVEASNGVIHVIDAVILPADIAATL
jgi:uncharacterized surface protein with fasciclin (FAS1) repeats